MNNAQRINQTSGKVEYYTPIEIIEAARSVMGGIDLDPASSRVANERVNATQIFTAQADGLTKQWHGRVWMNHPYSRTQNPLWINKIVDEYKMGNIDAACCITFASTSERWFQPLMNYPQCYLSPRTNYLLPDGQIKKGVTKGSVVTYLGTEVEKFVTAFRTLGKVMVPA